MAMGRFSAINLSVQRATEPSGDDCQSDV